MLTPCVHFRTYVREELPVIRRSRGEVSGYFLPTDPLHQKNAAALERSGVIIAMR